MPAHLDSDEPDLDVRARAIGKILGSRLDAQLTNAEYLDSRGQGNPESTALLRRAVQLRDARLDSNQEPAG